jgi:protein TonB
MSHGFFRSLADGESLRGDVRDYYFGLVRRVNEQWWATAAMHGAATGGREALVSITMTRQGEILAIRLVQSSGIATYDQLILEALQQTSPLPPLPESYPGEYFQAPLRLVAPSGSLIS